MGSAPDGGQADTRLLLNLRWLSAAGCNKHCPGAKSPCRLHLICHPAQTQAYLCSELGTILFEHHEVSLIGYVLFQSSQAAARAEAVLRHHGLPVRLVPVPRHLSSECSTALSFDAPDNLAQQVEAHLQDCGVPYVAIHLLAE